MDLTAIATNFDDVAKIVGAIIVIGGAAWSVWKIVLPAVSSVKRSFVQMEKIANIGDVILAEFRPNGGGSMKDAINRIETNINGIRNDAMRMDARQWAIVASLPDPVFETNSEGSYIRVNSAYMHLTGRSGQEVMGNGWEIVIHHEDRGRVWQEWHDAVQRLRSFESAFRLVDVDGIVYNAKCIAHPYKNPIDGTVLGYLGRLIDVKEVAGPVKK